MESKPTPADSPAVFFIQNSAEAQPPAKARRAGRLGTALMELAQLDAPLPPGFVLSTGHCAPVLASPDGLPAATAKALKDGLKQLETWEARRFGDARNPLLLAVRLSAPLELPVSQGPAVNLGLSLERMPELAEASGNARWAWDAYRRFAVSYALNVLRLPRDSFDALSSAALDEAGALEEQELSAAAVEKLARAVHERCAQAGAPLPQDPFAQLSGAVRNTFALWGQPRVRQYRRTQVLDDVSGVASVVQVMAYGTRGEQGVAGTVASRDPALGTRQLYGKYLPDADEFDLTAGTRIPDDIATLKSGQPDAFAQIETLAQRLERHFHNAVQFTFVVDQGALRVLTCAPANRTPRAGMRMALDLVSEGLASTRQALRSIDPVAIEQLMHPILDKSGNPQAVTKGLPASPGSAVGQVVFFAEHAEELAGQGKKIILVRHETTPEDIGGLNVAQGILTGTGGLTSHAAVVARGMGKCCVVGASKVHINYHINEMTLNGQTVKRGDWISLDGNTGEVYLGELPQIQPSVEGDLKTVLEWADDNRKLGVYANADTAGDARRAVELGAGGIGLCRTEHMFF
ncbi:MAG: pyruvate, phosphate dikinase, partial [Candidatus Lambdaproteobacteria bacterium]|nr:pyruvate, phosphate dikinase [Candidatus Lambdaproteobacteria bacterium]